MKRNIKNDLIKDYVVLKSIYENLGKNGINLNLKARVGNLLKIYENLIFRFGLMDLSFCLLTREISTTCTIIELKEVNSKVNKIEKDLGDKLRRLKVNEFETKFILTKF